MGTLTYAATMSLDGYVADADGEEWSPAEWEFARRWQGIDKVVVSSTLTAAELGSERDRLVPDLSMAELQRIVDSATCVVEIFGPTAAAAAIRAGMVDNFEFFVVPKVVGGGLRAPPDDVRLDLSLAEHRIFDDGIAHLRYRRSGSA